MIFQNVIVILLVVASLSFLARRFYRSSLSKKEGECGSCANCSALDQLEKVKK